jgi:hypothetical protein
MLLLAGIIFIGCKKPYTPPAVTSSPNYLVVEGVINVGTDLTTIKLSRTVKISSNTVSPETNAQVVIETDQNEVFQLGESAPGTYITYINADQSRKYRVRITTANSLQYVSDFEALKDTPPIDSIGYVIKNNKLQIYSNAHDATNNTRYYRWDYIETWQFNAKYFSEYIVNNQAAQPIQVRLPTEQVYTCFKSDTSSDIILGSSANLKQDVIYQNPITSIDQTSEKVEAKYSILLRQYALTKEAFDFWTTLKKNTEQLGSIFDAQPSQSIGNIHCISDPKQTVVGYISVTSTQSKRIFITNQQLPNNFIPTYPYDCAQDSALFFNPKTNSNDVAGIILAAPPGALDVTTPIFSAGAIIGYLYSTPICADCSLRGSVTAPYFWQ